VTSSYTRRDAVDNPIQVDMVLGDGARDRGARADHISELTPGVAYVRVEGSRELRRVRSAYLDDEAISQLAAACAAPRSESTDTAPRNRKWLDDHAEERAHMSARSPIVRGWSKRPVGEWTPNFGSMQRPRACPQAHPAGVLQLPDDSSVPVLRACQQRRVWGVGRIDDERTAATSASTARW